jgi:hypothetical protein
MWVVSLTSRPLYPQGKSPWCQLVGSLGASQSRSRCGGEEKNTEPPPGLEHPIMNANKIVWPVCRKHHYPYFRIRKFSCLFEFHFFYNRRKSHIHTSFLCRWYSLFNTYAWINFKAENIWIAFSTHEQPLSIVYDILSLINLSSKILYRGKKKITRFWTFFLNLLVEYTE